MFAVLEESSLLEKNQEMFKKIIDIFIQEGVQKAIQFANTR